MLTVNQVVEHYLSEGSQLAGEGSSVRYHASPIRAAPLGRRKVEKVTRGQIEAYCLARLLLVSFPTVDGELRLLRRAIGFACRELGVELAENPAMGIKLPRKQAKSVKITAGQLQALYDALDARPKMRSLVELAVETKMRRGELLGLRWDDLDLDAGLANLRGTTAHKPRTVSLSGRAVAILRNLERPHDRVFHMSVQKLRWAFDRACRTADLEGLRFNDLRQVTERVARSVQGASTSIA